MAATAAIVDSRLAVVVDFGRSVGPAGVAGSNIADLGRCHKVTAVPDTSLFFNYIISYIL